MGIQSIIHTSYFIIHSTGFPGTITPPPILLTPYSILPKHEPHEHAANVEAVSLRPAHPLSDQSFEGRGAFRRSLDVGGIDNFVSLFIELEGELEVFGNAGPPAEALQEVSADHVDTPRDLLHTSVQFRSRSLNDIASCVFGSHSPRYPVLAFV